MYVVGLYMVVGLIIFLTALMEERVKIAKGDGVDILYGAINKPNDGIIFTVCIMCIYALGWPLITICWFVYNIVENK